MEISILFVCLAIYVKFKQMDKVIRIKINSSDDNISWQFEQRPMAPKSEWLWALAIFGFAMVIFGIILKNYLLIVIIALTVFIIYTSKNKTLEFHSFKLSGEGLYINGKIYPYESFESFWIFKGNEIAFRSKKRFMPLLITPFNGKDEQIIRKILSEHLPEVEEEESFLDLLQKKIF